MIGIVLERLKGFSQPEKALRIVREKYGKEAVPELADAMLDAKIAVWGKI